jgi:hypothetical protein
LSDEIVMKTTEQNKITMLLFIVSILGAYKFYEVGKSTQVERSIASVATVEGVEATPEEVAEEQLDLELLSLQQRLGGNQIKKCYDNRLSCGGNRNHSKCITDKVSYFLNCANLDKQEVAQLKQKINQ